MLIGVISAIIISLIFGIFLSRFRLTKVFNAFMNILSTIPDFIIIIMSMILAVKIYRWTGIRVISLRPDAGALNLWFPTFLVAIAPTLYLFKLISVKYYETSGEDYIKTAVAKGMSLNYINFQHVYKNIEPFIKAELIKVISLAIGNLFIIEYIMNVSGITKFIFQSNQVQPIAIGLFAMLLISGIVYLVVRIVFYLFKRGFIYE
nr:ABC transporter permease subunit [Cytobacillus eiseniae]